MMATTPTELAPGSPAPGVQPPLENQSPIVLPNPVVPAQAPYSVEPIPGTNKAVTNPYNNEIDFPRPERVAHAVPPLGKGWGADDTIILAKSVNLPESGVYPTATVGIAPGQQANLIPLVAFPVLSRIGPQGVSWAAPAAIAGLTSATFRGTYRDLKITPGWRGIQLQYKTGSITSVTVTENTTGMKYIFGVGTNRALVFAPLFMLREFFDITIAAAGAAFPADATCLLTTEEQLPFQWLS